jgi:hypothetical protein
MNEREYDLLTAAPATGWGESGGDKHSRPSQDYSPSADKSRWLRATNRAGAFVRGLYVGAGASERP